MVYIGICGIFSRPQPVGKSIRRNIYETSCVRGGLSGNHPCSPKETRYGAIRRCGPAHGGVVDVARHMEVSKPSVCHAVATLRDGGFLTMDEDHFLHLTDVGREVAEKIYERHCFFTEQLIAAGVDPRTAEADACRIEHVISNESFQKLKDALED